MTGSAGTFSVPAGRFIKKGKEWGGVWGGGGALSDLFRGLADDGKRWDL